MAKSGKNNKSHIIIILIVCAVLISMAAAITMLSDSVEDNLYYERKSSLTYLVESTARVIAETVEAEWDYNRFAGRIVEQQLPDSAGIEDFIAGVGQSIVSTDTMFFLVDSEGNYYSSDGVRGLVENRDYYTTKSANEAEYLSTLAHLDRDETWLILRTRLETPVTTTYNGRPVEIRYCATMHDLHSLNETVAGLFEGANNTFIIDVNGTMLYKQFGLGMLIDGYNVFTKLYQIALPYDEEPDDLLRQMQNHESLCFKMVINQKEYYFCSAYTEVSDWSVCMAIGQEFIERNSDSRFDDIVYSIAVVAVIIAALIIAVAIAMNRSREEKKQEQIRQMMSARHQEELAQALNQAQAANRAKTTFLNNMSHDIRTPMNAIIGFSNIARKNVDDRPKLMDCLDKIQGSSEHLLSLINDILDMSRIESGKVTINEEANDLTDILRGTADIISEDVTAKQQTLTVNTDGIIHSRVLCDRLRVNQVLLNIISNAVKYTPAGGSIEVTASEDFSERSDENIYRIAIRDNGIGMSREFAGTVFEAFTRENSSTVSGIQGTGLGMAITNSIIEMMHGHISVESEEGKGSTFTNELPLRTMAAGTAGTAAGLTGVAAGAAGGTVGTGNVAGTAGSALGTAAGTAGGTAGTGSASGGVQSGAAGIATGMTAGLAGNASGGAMQTNAVTVGAADMQKTDLLKGLKALLVEDVELNREIAIDMLEEEGMEVEAAVNGQEAVDKVAASKPGQYDLILMDIQMPVMDGYEATRQIRKLDTLELASIPIIAMTANAFAEDRELALQAGMDGHIAKPIKIEAVQQVIIKTLERVNTNGAY